MKNSKNIFYRNPQFSKCPSCKTSGSLKRSRSRNMFEQIIRRSTFIKTYRCKECGWRGYRSTLILTRRSIKTILIYLLMIVITAYIARYFILTYGLK